MLALVLAVAIACSDGTAAGPPSAAAGSWSYSAAQDTPSPATLDGTVSWRDVPDGSGTFEGTYAIVERQPDGTTRSLTGSGAGQVINDTIADFDLTVSGATRRHIGVLRGDSIAGNLATLDQSPAAGGRFVLHRAR